MGLIVLSLNHVSLWPPWSAACQASVLHYLPEFAQTHVHWVVDAIQSSHPLLSPFPPALNLSSIRVFSNESALCIRWPKYWSFSFNVSQRHYFTDKGPSSQSYGFSSSHVWMWELDHKESWAEELMLLNYSVGEDSWESLGLQGDPTSPFWRRSTLGFLWKEWC